jgi:anthranilate synthase/aminodeoxychorismate synthase-like glutamine amidotransferase
MILLIDNYDSFTWNLVQALWACEQEVKVVTNDAHGVEALLALGPRGIVVSPGPCSPAEAGVSVEAIRAFAPRVPVLGVCLGHQALAAAFGGKVVRAPLPMHGKMSEIAHHGVGVFADLPQPFPAVRYHSLVAERSSLPAALEVTAWTGDLVMGLQLVGRPVFGVQFHPESFFTAAGAQLIGNFVRACA